MRILVHACCGPCSLEPVRLLEEEGHELAIAYSNPNIHPEAEYLKRLETLQSWADGEGIEVIPLVYDPETWEHEVGVHGTDRAERCRACYRMRLQRTAAHAVEHGFEAITTTLSVSPYQLTEVIAEELERAAAEAGIRSCFRDFRPHYQQATILSREMRMYRQWYCGCHLSMEESKREREERFAARKASKEARRAARASAEQYCAAIEARSRMELGRKDAHEDR